MARSDYSVGGGGEDNRNTSIALMEVQFSNRGLLAGYQLRLEMLEDEPFPEFDLKNWRIIGFSPALAGKAGILFLCYIIFNSNIS